MKLSISTTVLSIQVMAILTPLVTGSHFFREVNPVVSEFLTKVSATQWSRGRHELQATTSRPNHSTCSAPLLNWTNDKLQEIEEKGVDHYSVFEVGDDVSIADVIFTISDILFLQKVVFADGDKLGEEYFGANGQHTAELHDRHHRIEHFWEASDRNDVIDTDDVWLLGLHGADLENYENLATVLLFYFEGITYFDALHYASNIQTFVESLPRGYDNPLLTANAAAVDEAGVTGVSGFSDAIFLGDGIFDFLKEHGLSNDGPDFVHAHEFGHHMQYEVNLLDVDELLDSEESRWVELMADAFGAYFLASDRGGNMDPKGILKLYEAAFSVGDCEVEADIHHGTPLQRECAAMWGASLAVKREQAILNPSEFAVLFDSDVQSVIDLDDRVCSRVVRHYDDQKEGALTSSSKDDKTPETRTLQGRPRQVVRRGHVGRRLSYP